MNLPLGEDDLTGVPSVAAIPDHLEDHGLVAAPAEGEDATACCKPAGAVTITYRFSVTKPTRWNPASLRVASTSETLS